MTAYLAMIIQADLCIFALIAVKHDFVKQGGTQSRMHILAMSRRRTGNIRM